jgi:hypothetical protein
MTVRQPPVRASLSILVTNSSHSRRVCAVVSKIIVKAPCTESMEQAIFWHWCDMRRELPIHEAARPEICLTSFAPSQEIRLKNTDKASTRHSIEWITGTMPVPIGEEQVKPQNINASHQNHFSSINTTASPSTVTLVECGLENSFAPHRSKQILQHLVSTPHHDNILERTLNGSVFSQAKASFSSR